MPAPVAQGLHPLDPLSADLGREHRTEAVPPKPDSLMTDLDTAFMQVVLDVAQR
jgi:hypothetical protein